MNNDLERNSQHFFGALIGTRHARILGGKKDDISFKREASSFGAKKRTEPFDANVLQLGALKSQA
jgi:hypothetical protein